MLYHVQKSVLNTDHIQNGILTMYINGTNIVTVQFVTIKLTTALMAGMDENDILKRYTNTIVQFHKKKKLKQ